MASTKAPQDEKSSPLSIEEQKLLSSSATPEQIASIAEMVKCARAALTEPLTPEEIAWYARVALAQEGRKEALTLEEIEKLKTPTQPMTGGAGQTKARRAQP